jgi:GAF domain-containing protein
MLFLCPPYFFLSLFLALLPEFSSLGNFTFDEHIQTNKVKSVLCVPIVQQNAVVGILYFENNLLPGAFSPDRVHLSALLSTAPPLVYLSIPLFMNV